MKGKSDATPAEALVCLEGPQPVRQDIRGRWNLVPAVCQSLGIEIVPDVANRDKKTTYMALKKSDGEGIATLLVSVHAELDRDSQTLSGCLQELAERYVTPSSVSAFYRGGIPCVSIADMDADPTALEVRRDKTLALKQVITQQLRIERTRLV